jgi:hypothetical protein
VADERQRRPGRAAVAPGGLRTAWAEEEGEGHPLVLAAAAVAGPLQAAAAAVVVAAVAARHYPHWLPGQPLRVEGVAVAEDAAAHRRW